MAKKYAKHNDKTLAVTEEAPVRKYSIDGLLVKKKHLEDQLVEIEDLLDKCKEVGIKE